MGTRRAFRGGVNPVTSDENFSPNWTNRESYAHTVPFSRREWAWEFLRRNPDFIECWRHAQLEYGLYRQDGTTTIILSVTADLALRKWGCLYASTPDQDARAASVFWCPELSPGVLRLSMRPAVGTPDADDFTLSNVYSPSVVLELKDGQQHILFTHEGRWLQVFVEGADILKPGRYSLNISLDRRVSKEKRRLLRCFDDLRFSGRLMTSHFQPTSSGRRLRFLLQALDGYLAGADQREIAIALMGEKRVGMDWRSPTWSLRDQVRRAIYRGRKLMLGGYRKFLG